MVCSRKVLAHDKKITSLDFMVSIHNKWLSEWKYKLTIKDHIAAMYDIQQRTAISREIITHDKNISLLQYMISM